MKILNIGSLIASTLCVFPLGAQSLTGVVTAADTGAPLAGVSVVAIRKSASPNQVPAILQSVTDGNGRYAIAAPPGQYSICVHPMLPSLYLDPCQWLNPVAAVVGASTASAVSFSLQRGARFIVRVHDTKGLLPIAEGTKGAAVSAVVAGASLKQFPLPLIFSDGLIRDYGAVVPIGVPLSAAVSSNTLALAGAGGTALSAAPMPFQILPTDIEATGAPQSPITRMFPPPDARIIHVYANALK